VSDSQQPSGPVAVVLGVLTIACGLLPLLLGFGRNHPTAPSTAPTWMGIAICLVFISGGFSVIVDYGIAHRRPDGEYPPNTSPYVRLADTLIGLVIVGLMAAIFAWVAFGPGPRAFSSFIAIPFLAVGVHSSELTGRIAFGFGAVLFALMFLACGVSGLKRLRRAITGPDKRLSVQNTSAEAAGSLGRSVDGG
jgi:hypothetical protein